jgi:DNA-binding IclR family transcriptional regulator
MSGIDRYVRVLRLFTEKRSSWTVAEMADALDASSSTIYRTVREMVAVGFLESTVEAHYRLGPAFTEYERTIRVSDPLIRSGAVFLEPLVEQVGIPSTAVLARLYGDRVMCVAEARSPQFRLRTSYERGRPMPILRGATSRAILAGLASRRRNKLLKVAGPAEAGAQARLLAELDSIRKAGICVTHGEVDKGLVGIAAPIQNRSLGIDASLSFIVAEPDFTDAAIPRIYSLLSSHAQLIENYMEDAFQDLSRRSGTLPVA